MKSGKEISEVSGFLKTWIDRAQHEPAATTKTERRVAALKTKERKLTSELEDLTRKLLDHGAVLAHKHVKIEADRKKGGSEAGKQRKAGADARYKQWRREAHDLIASGERDARNVAGILANRHSVHAATIRRGLDKAKRKTRTS